MCLRTNHEKLCLRKENRIIIISRRNYPYLFDLIGNFDYYFDSVKPANKDGLLIQDFSKRTLQTQQEDGMPFWCPSLPEPMATTKIYLDEGNLSLGEIVLDLGAYSGAASYFFSQAVGEQGHVYAFEPDRESFDCLQSNIALHNLFNVTPFQKGVWSSSGKVLFQSEGNMGSAIRDAADRLSHHLVTIQTTSLSDFCDQNAVKKVDFVKVDIEGSEVEVLEHSSAFIDAFKPRFAIEIHRLGTGLTDGRVIAALQKHGYSYRIVPQAGLPLPLLFAEPTNS